MIHLTTAAKEKIISNMRELPTTTVLRVGIKKTGCTGYAYVIEYIDISEIENEIKHEIDGVDVYINPDHDVFLSEMTVDFQKKGINRVFEFINPNESARCGCGESFTI